MEIDITDFVLTAETHNFSASIAEMGPDAGKITWANAVRDAEATQFISDETRDAFEDWVIVGLGAWTRDEIETWSLDECNALLIQYISGDLNELESLCFSSKDKYQINWSKARQLSERGTIGGSIYKGDDGRVYFYMGS